jgi:hypothetical protein
MRFNYTFTDIFTITNLKLSAENDRESSILKKQYYSAFARLPAANYGECVCCRIQLFLFNIHGDSQLALF